MPLLTWIGDDKRREATFHGCKFTLTKLKRGYRLRGKGKIPPDGGFSIDSSGGEAAMMGHAETLVAAYVHVTGKS